MRGIEVLREKGIPLHAIAVLTERSLDYPDELFDFFASTGFRTVGFNLEETEGSHVVSLAGVHPERLSVKYTAFMDRLFDRWVAAGGQPRIREFQVMAGAISGFMKDNEFRRTPDDVVAFRNIIVNKQGDVFTFSPELASGVPGERARFSIGNVHNLPSASALFSSKKFQILDAEVAKGLARCERECEYFRICGGGSCSNKFYEKGTFDCAETFTCSLHLKQLAKVVASKLRNLSATRDIGWR